MTLSRLYARAARMPLLVGLLVVTFAIAADLVHEAWATALSQQQTAERAARDFVRFSATSTAYAAQASIELGLRTLFAFVGGNHGRPAVGPATLEQSAARIRDCRCAPVFQPSYYFRLDLARGDVVTSGDAPSSDEERRWLRDTLMTHARAVRHPDWDAALIYGGVDSRPRVVAYAVRGDSHAYGFVSDVGAFGDAAFAPVVRDRLRRDVEVALQAASYDSLMRTFVLAPDGHAVYDANPRRPEVRVTMAPRAGHETYVPVVEPVTPTTLFADTVRLGDQFGDLRLDVALATTEPGALVAGGLSRSRLLALLGMLLLMAGLVAAVVLQLRREHELSRLRAELTAGVSHELRTPLAQILLFGETLMLERTRSERERRAAAEVIVREARRLMHLVENALHFTRADRQLLHFSPESIDLAAVTREILVSFAPLAWTAKVSLREVIEEPAPAHIDGAAYRQIVLNLLENAVRYGPSGQTVTVRVERMSGGARLVVEDEGPGIAVADRERVFAPFVRLTSGPSASMGTGIGLAVVRDLAVRHQGEARVERTETGGARLVVELPSGGRTPPKDSGHPGAAPPTRAAL
ncbi:MAG TPA: HAMP domain-containing sensor histidine kinase [Gemmatimonadaceae bacterium]